MVIEPVNDRAALRRFLKTPWPIYADDPCWVPPLLFERLEHLDPRKNPYFDQAETAFWTARRGDTPVGRISAQVNRAHLEQHRDTTSAFSKASTTPRSSRRFWKRRKDGCESAASRVPWVPSASPSTTKAAF